ncbi:MAG: GatB/YqeY domain-containing protein [Candidatus Omnitrophica bacterium]|nr:GatB/YqeY domain-containing protein [Candidatus Omnitrophota bacterium]
MRENDLSNELKHALKSGNKVKLSVVRMLMSEVKNKKIEDRVKELDERTVLALTRKMAKRYKESIEKFREGGREDLVEKESSELEVLEEYLPEQMPEKEIEAIVDRVISETGATSMKDMGRVMGSVLEETAGRCDGGTVSGIVKSRLS